MIKWRSDSGGQALVEMAIALPMLILLIIGIFEVALMANTYLTVQHAAREAVRVGITGAANNTIWARAQSTASTLDAGRLEVVVNPARARTTGSDLAVTVSYRYEPVTPLFGPLKEIKLTSRLTGRVE